MCISKMVKTSLFENVVKLATYFAIIFILMRTALDAVNAIDEVLQKDRWSPKPQ